MADNLAEILKNDLMVENDSLRDLMFETLHLCERPGGPLRAIRKLDAKRKKFSSGIDFLDNVPYCCLFLSYACFKRDDYPNALRWARVAIDGLDQTNHVWNRSIARWIIALLYQQSKQPDDAEIYFEAAIKLMEQERKDNKRRSRYEKAKACESLLERMREDFRLLKTSILVHLPLPVSTDDAHIPEDTGVTIPEENEGVIFQNLVKKLGVTGTREQAEGLIEHECKRAPEINRVEAIRRAIERWEYDNR